MQSSRPHAVLRYAVGAILPLMAVLVTTGYRTLIQPMLGLPFFGAVIVTLWVGGSRPALLAAALSSSALGYLLGATGGPGGPWPAGILQVLLFAFVSLFLINRASALQDTKNVLFATLSSLGDALIATGSSGRVIFANRCAAELLGLPVEQLEGQRLRDLWPELAGKGGEIERGGRSFDRYASRLRGYGELFTLRETTASKKHEQRRILLENLIANMREGFHMVDLATGEILMANRAMHEMAGYAQGELLGKHVSILFGGAGTDQAAGWEAILEQLRRDCFWKGELVSRRKDGSELITLTTVACYLEGEKLFCATVKTDVTASRRAEEALRHSEQRFRSLVASMRDVVFTLDTNQRLTGVYGGHLGERTFVSNRLLGRTAREIFGPARAEVHERASARVLTGESVEFEWPLERKEGKLWFHSSLSPLRNDDDAVTGVVGVARDITERKLLEERLRRAQKMDAVGRLAGGVAHDFNNLLTVVTGYSQMMIEDLDAREPAHDYAEAVLKAGNRAALLTSQLLAFSGRQVVQPEVLDINGVVERLDAVLRRFLDDGIILETHLAADLGCVQADPSQIEHIIMDLAANARDAMPAGGTLTIATANVQLDATTRRAVAPGSYAMLSVRDTGTGMSPEAMAHLFEPFFSTKGVGKGTGLGLSSVYGIARQNGGDVEVESEPDRGTAVRLYLPLVDAPAAVRPEPELDSLRGSESILVVEDEAGVRALTVEILRKYGYQVLQAADGPEAIELAGDRSHKIDLLLSDVLMPLMSGQEVARRVACVRPLLKVVYMSAHSEDAIASMGMGPETPLVRKPFVASALARRIREVLDRVPGA